MNTSIKIISAHDFEKVAARSGTDLPIEQSSAWDLFDESVEGRSPWARFIFLVDNEPRALISLTEVHGRGFTYVMAKHGPVWLGAAPSTEDEENLINLLTPLIRRRNKHFAYLQMEFSHPHKECMDILQSIPVDRTVVIDLTKDSDDAVLASYSSRGRRSVRKALRNKNLHCSDETASASENFSELYEIMATTAKRDGFNAQTEENLRAMLQSLGPEHARIFVARNSDGEPLGWSLLTVNGTHSTYYYAASSDKARKEYAAHGLIHFEATTLRGEGVTSLDLFGIASDRSPSLAGVTEFKLQFGPASDVPQAWAIPLSKARYYSTYWAKKARVKLREAKENNTLTLAGGKKKLSSLIRSGASQNPKMSEPSDTSQDNTTDTKGN